jgi:hypothetical protein
VTVQDEVPYQLLTFAEIYANSWGISVIDV